MKVHKLQIAKQIKVLIVLVCTVDVQPTCSVMCIRDTCTLCSRAQCTNACPDSHALWASSCIHALSLLCTCCLLLFGVLRWYSQTVGHTIHLQLGELFNGCYELRRWLYAFNVTCYVVTRMAVLSVYIYTQYTVTVRSSVYTYVSYVMHVLYYI